MYLQTLGSIENKQQWCTMQMAKCLEYLVLTLTHFFCQNYFFQRVWRVYIYLWKFRRGGCLILCSKNGNSGGGGERDLCEIPSMVGGYTFSGT